MLFSYYICPVFTFRENIDVERHSSSQKTKQRIIYCNFSEENVSFLIREATTDRAEGIKQPLGPLLRCFMLHRNDADESIVPLYLCPRSGDHRAHENTNVPRQTVARQGEVMKTSPKSLIT